MAISALADLDQLDNDALKALVMQLESELRQQRETAAQQEAGLAALEAEFAVQRQKLAEQGDELRRRYTHAGAGAGHRQDQNRPPVDLCL